MRILLFTPIQRTYVVMPNLGLGYLASIARKEGHEVTILSCVLEKMDIDGFETHIRHNQYDLIGVQAFTYDIGSVNVHLDTIKRVLPSAVTVVGGPHPSGDPREVFSQIPKVDYAFAGESEIGFAQFVNKLEQNGKDNLDLQCLSEIPGLIWRDKAVVHVNPNRFPDDLDCLPFPAWDLIDPRRFPEAPHGAFARNFPVAPIIVSRGCPCRCTFCGGKAITGRRVRWRSIDNVVQEMKHLIREYGVREFNVEDENLTIHRNLAMEFCQRIIDDKLNISWNCPSGVRLDTLDQRMLQLMESSGCYSFGLGIESGSDRILNLMKKNISAKQIIEKTTLIAKSTNIKMTGFFMLGYPGETHQERQNTIDMSRQIPIHRVQYNNFMPLPGSEIYDDLKKNNNLGNIDWSHYFVHDVAYLPEGTTLKEFKWLQRKGYLKFYLRPHIIFNLLKEIRSYKHLLFLVRRFYDAMRG